MKDLGTKTLETDNLILRKLELNDYKSAFKNWCNDPDVAKYVVWNPHKSDEDTKKLFEMWVKQYEEPYTFRWGVVEKSSNEIIGVIDVVKISLNNSRVEIGYCYGKKWWGKGYGTESLKAVINYLLNEIEIEMVTADHLVSNPASGRVMEKAGMKYICTMPKWMINKEGKREDLKCYAIFKNNNL